MIATISTIQVMVFLWQVGVVDSLTLLQFCINCGAQYGGLVVGEAAGGTIASFIGHMKSIIELIIF